MRRTKENTSGREMNYEERGVLTGTGVHVVCPVMTERANTKTCEAPLHHDRHGFELPTPRCLFVFLLDLLFTTAL